MTIKKLHFMPYAQAHMEIMDNGNIYLWSYSTLVAGIERGWAFCNGTYSQTTRRHIGAFAKEMSARFDTNIDYHTFKSLFENNLIMDIKTGEVVDRVQALSTKKKGVY